MHGYKQELPPFADNNQSEWFEKADLSFLKTPTRKSSAKCSLHNSVVVQKEELDEDDENTEINIGVKEDGYVNYVVETDINFEIGTLTVEEKKQVIERARQTTPDCKCDDIDESDMMVPFSSIKKEPSFGTSAGPKRLIEKSKSKRSLFHVEIVDSSFEEATLDDVEDEID